MNVEVVLQYLWKSSGITIRVLDHTNKQRCQLLFVEKLDKKCQRGIKGYFIETL
jgi:hypothetical protein